MRRKIIQIAESTQLVSLPRKWALAQGLKKGDELEVQEEGTRLIVSTLNAPHKGGVEADLTGLDRDSLMFFVRAMYKIGYDEIKLNFKQPRVPNIRTGKTENILEVISQEVARLTGIEIFSHKQNFCILRSISEDSAKAFDGILRRVFILSAETISDLVNGFANIDKHVLETIQSKHDAITRLVVYSQRLLNKLGHPNYEKKDVYYHILELFDELLDIVKYNARELLKSPFKPSKESMKIYEELQNVFNDFYHLFYDFKVSKIAGINQQRYEMIDLIQKSLKKIPKSEIILLAQIEQASEKIINMTVSTMSLKY